MARGCAAQVGKAFAGWEALFVGLFRCLRQRREMRQDADPAALAAAIAAL